MMEEMITEKDWEEVRDDRKCHPTLVGNMRITLPLQNCNLSSNQRRLPIFQSTNHSNHFK